MVAFLRAVLWTSQISISSQYGALDSIHKGLETVHKGLETVDRGLETLYNKGCRAVKATGSKVGSLGITARIQALKSRVLGRDSFARRTKYECTYTLQIYGTKFHKLLHETQLVE